jgi:hypothetical protein
MTEILNIEYHTIRLIVKALNRCKTMEEAAAELGVHSRSLYSYKRIYGIKRINKRYQAPKKTFIVLPVMERFEKQ